MSESLDSLDFCMEMQVEKNSAIPLECWQTISLSDIWIPSQLLPNRHKGSNAEGTRGIFHTLQKKNTSKYFESFSIYVESDMKKEKETRKLTDNLSVNLDDVPTHFSNCDDKKYFENKTDSAVFRRNDDSVCSILMSPSINNLCNYDKQKNGNVLYVEENSEKSHKVVGKDDNIFIQNAEKIGFDLSHSNSASKSVFLEQVKKFNNKQTLKKVNDDSDSNISLNEIINDPPVASLKEFDCNFEIRKKKKMSDDYSICDKQKASTKTKKAKKVKKCIPLNSLFEDNNATQEFNCNRYMNNILREKERYAQVGDNPLVSKEEYPDLPRQISEELLFYQSDNMEKVENVEFTPKFSFIHSDKGSMGNIVSHDEILNDLNKFEVSTNVNVKDEETSSKIVIENIPHDVSKDDVFSILSGYGEIEDFSLISTEKCRKVFVKIHCNIDCDIDWVIECLNGSEPFGTSTGVLKCYQQTE